jgi:hypothetical protein
VPNERRDVPKAKATLSDLRVLIVEDNLGASNCWLCSDVFAC